MRKIIQEKQPEVYKMLNKKKKERKKHLSLRDIEELMQNGAHVYKRAKGGAWRQVR